MWCCKSVERTLHFMNLDTTESRTNSEEISRSLISHSGSLVKAALLQNLPCVPIAVGWVFFPVYREKTVLSLIEDCK